MAGVGFIGQRISLISKSQIRYVGTLHNINVEDSTISLKDVKVLGTEGRREDHEVPPREDPYDYVIFKTSDINDLDILTSEQDQGPTSAEQELVDADPAIVSAKAPKPQAKVISKSHKSNGQERMTGQSNKLSKQPVHSGLKGEVTPPTAESKAKHYLNAKPVTSSGAHQADNLHSNSKSSYANKVRQTSAPGNVHRKEYHSATQQNHPREKAIPGMGKHLLFRRLRGVTEESKKQLNELNSLNRQKEEFDFSSMNQKFNEMQMESKEKEDEINDAEHTEEVEEANVKHEAAYNKTSSFFDNLSSDIADREKGKSSNGKLSNNEERKLNTETFGAIALSNNRNFGRYNYKNGKYQHNNRRPYNGYGSGAGNSRNNNRYNTNSKTRVERSGGAKVSTGVKDE